MSNRLTSVVIVTCCFGGYFPDCLNSLLAQEQANLEIAVIDNSLDKYFSLNTARDFPQVKLYAQKERLSYCQSLNLGIRKTESDFVLCLNDDVRLGNDFILRSLEGFSKSADIGSVSGKILRPDAKTIDSAGLYLSLFLSAKERGYAKKDTGQFETPGYIFAVNGAVAFYRRQMLEEIKIADWYFDPEFGFFYEDLDLGWRAQKKGWKAYYIPKAIAYHARGGSLRSPSGVGKRNARKYLSVELCAGLVINRYLCMIRNANPIDILLKFPAAVLYEFCVWSYMLIFRFKTLKIIFLKRRFLLSAISKRFRRIPQ